VARKKPEGIESLKPKQDPISIQEITMLDWYAAFALLGQSPMSTPEDTAHRSNETGAGGVGL
jgi:hypothetical protein